VDYLMCRLSYMMRTRKLNSDRVLIGQPSKEFVENSRIRQSGWLRMKLLSLSRQIWTICQCTTYPARNLRDLKLNYKESFLSTF
jgi:hypothetical protein